MPWRRGRTRTSRTPCSPKPAPAPAPPTPAPTPTPARTLARTLGPSSRAPADPRAAEIVAILAKETGIPAEQLRPEASIEALGIASLDMVQAIFEIESRWNVEVPVVAERSGAEFTTIGDLLAHVLHALDGPAATHRPGA